MKTGRGTWQSKFPNSSRPEDEHLRLPAAGLNYVWAPKQFVVLNPGGPKTGFPQAARTQWGRKSLTSTSRFRKILELSGQRGFTRRTTLVEGPNDVEHMWQGNRYRLPSKRSDSRMATNFVGTPGLNQHGCRKTYRENSSDQHWQGNRQTGPRLEDAH